MSNYPDFQKILSENGVEISREFENFLKIRRFFDLPSSINHHGNSQGGLVRHSCCVAQTLVDLTRDNHLTWERKESPVIVGMFHDLCKLEAYAVDMEEKYMTGRAVFHYADGKNQLYTGHGEKSVLMLAEWMKLTAEEIACIRWHMGAFDDRENWNHYTAAVRKFHNVLWTHHADMIAAHIYHL